MAPETSTPHQRRHAPMCRRVTRVCPDMRGLRHDPVHLYSPYTRWMDSRAAAAQITRPAPPQQPTLASGPRRHSRGGVRRLGVNPPTPSQRCSHALARPVSTSSPHSQTCYPSTLLLPWYLGRACGRPYPPRRRPCRRPTCKHLPRAAARLDFLSFLPITVFSLSQFPPFRFLSAVVIRRKHAIISAC